MNGPDGKKFPWGRIVETHTIGEFSIVEFTDRHGATGFSVYVKGEHIGEGSISLDGALLIALAHKYLGRHSGGAHWMARLIGLKEGP